MSTRFEQVTAGSWPSGIDKPIAALRASPEALERTYGLKFSAGRDELDDFVEAGLRLESGRPVLLVRYRGVPGPGTTVSVDQGDDAAEALDELRGALDLPMDALLWVSEEIAGARPPSVPDARASVFAAAAERIARWMTAVSRASRRAVR